MRKNILSVSLVALFCLFSAQSIAGKHDWVIGDWLHTFDPDGDTQDKLTFRSGGRFVTTEVKSRKTIDGMYFVKSDRVQVSLVRNDKIFMKLILTYDENKDRLYYMSEATGNTSYYTKM